MNRILVYTPTYDDLLQPETVASVKAQQFDGELVHEIDDRELIPGKSNREVCLKYQYARQMALDGGYNALLCVEHDMILPDDCIQVLWDTPAPVVYAAYMLRHGWHVVNLFRKEHGHNIGMSLSLYPAELRQAKRLEVIEVSGAGQGCTLIRRDVLEKIPFRLLDEPPDLAFAGDCIRAGIKQVGRFDVACQHINIDTGEVLSVNTSEHVTRVEALQDVTVQAGSKSMVLKHNRYYSMPLQDAKELERAGYVRISNSDTGEEKEIAVTVAYETPETPTAKVRKRKPRKRKPRAVS